MKKLTATAFDKLTVAQTIAALPAEVTSSGKTIFYAVAQLPDATAPTVVTGFTNEQVLKILLGNDTDPVHVADAQKRINAVVAAPPAAPSPVPSTPAQPNTPTPAPSDAKVGKPNWLGEWSGNVKDFVKGVVDATNDTSLFVLYNIPGRDNGNYSSGGLHSIDEYVAWVSNVAAGIGSKKAICILEPDALGLSRSLSSTVKADRYYMLQKAINILRANANTKVYIDSSIWAGVDDSVNMLKQFTGLNGFSVNVSGYEAMSICTDYADKVAQATGLHYVVDTSRNGNGNPHPGKWCNVTDTKVGLPATFNTGKMYCDAYLWIKVPGESDGLKINGSDGDGGREIAPSAGTPWAEYRDAIYSGDWTAFKKKYNV